MSPPISGDASGDDGGGMNEMCVLTIVPMYSLFVKSSVLRFVPPPARELVFPFLFLCVC